MPRIGSYIYFFCLFISLTCHPVTHSRYEALTGSDELPGMQIVYDSTYNAAAQKLFDVVHYTIRLEVDADDKQILAEVEAEGYFTGKTTQLVFNLYDNLRLDSLFLNNERITCSRANNKIVISGEFENGQKARVRAVYHGTPKQKGFASFVFGKVNGTPLIHTLNEPQYASTWFFCDDDPADKALIDFFITADSSLTAVSNGLLEDISTRGTRRTSHWKCQYPIATYLTCFYLSRYNHFREFYVSPSNDTLPIDYYYTSRKSENAKRNVSGQAEIIGILSALFGEYPFMKEKYGIAEFLWLGGAMEHQTITGVSTTMLNSPYPFEDVYVHELAHHWWGNSVTPASWKDIWLNEGFASYAEYLYHEKRRNTNEARDKLIEFSAFNLTGTLYNPSGDLFSNTVYHKGAWVLHMLRSEMGDSAFFSALTAYYQKYKYANASTEDFIRECENFSPRPLRAFFNQWVFMPNGIPLLEYSWVSRQKSAKEWELTLNVRQKGATVFNIPLDVEIIADKGYMETIRLDSSIQRFSFTVASKPREVTLNRDMRLLAEITHAEEESGQE